MRPFIPSHWELLEGRGTVAVASESDPHRQYFVGLRTLKCSCPQARLGHICKHGRWVHANRTQILTQKKGGFMAPGGTI